MGWKRKVGLIVLGVVLVSGAAMWAYISWFWHPQFLSASGAEALVMVIKKAFSDMLVIKRSPPGGAPPYYAPGILAAYEANPERFKRDAKLFDAWAAATALADDVFQAGPEGSWVRGSAEVGSGHTRGKDPWGHTFCVLRREDVVLVISAGPKAQGSPVCHDIPITAKELRTLPQGKLLESPSGSLILVREKKPS